MKLQPFEPFRSEYIDRLLKLNKKFLVTQTYNLSGDTFENGGDEKVSLLVSEYEELSRAKTHCNTLKENDRFAAVIHLELAGHRQKMLDLLQPESRFHLYFAAIKSKAELEKHLDQECRNNMRRWIDKHTTWRIYKDVAIRPSLQLIFGILYIQLKYAGQTVKIKFEELEKA
jgi:hypothetical protein